MQGVWTEVVGFLHLWALPIAVVSVALFVLSLFLTPYIVARIPADYYSDNHDHQSLRKSKHRTLVEFILVSIKNVLGALLLLLGIIMIFGPGPGMLIILFGLSIMNFPGKCQLERWIISRPGILQGVNTIRRKHGQPPLIEFREDRR